MKSSNKHYWKSRNAISILNKTNNYNRRMSSRKNKGLWNIKIFNLKKLTIIKRKIEIILISKN